MPDIEGVPYEATGGKLDQATAQALAARHREAASAGVGAASAAVAPVQAQVSALSSRVDSQDAKTLTDAKAYTDSKVTGFATTVAMNAADALTLSNAKAYTDQQLADFDSFVGVPIFETLAEAEAWEAANPGRKALTLEPSTPDTTPPTWNATLTVGTPTDKSVVVTASALATDDRRVDRYEVTYNGTSWATIVPSGKSFTLTGSPATMYSSTRLRAVDAAGNVSAPLSVPSYTMDAAPALPPVVSESFGHPDGPLAGQKDATGKTWITAASGAPFGASWGLDRSCLVSGGAAVTDPSGANKSGNIIPAGVSDARFDVTYEAGTNLAVGFGMGETNGRSVQIYSGGVNILQNKVEITRASGAPQGGTASITVTGTSVTVKVPGMQDVTATTDGQSHGTDAGLRVSAGRVTRLVVTPL